MRFGVSLFGAKAGHVRDQNDNRVVPDHLNLAKFSAIIFSKLNHVIWERLRGSRCHCPLLPVRTLTFGSVVYGLTPLLACELL